MNPLISIVVPAYNREKIIGSTLESIIAQDYGNLEIIVVDDASDDGTADAARAALGKSSRRWRVLTHERNRGVSAARNTGMDAADGEYILFMDSDDLADPDFISTLYELISGNDSDIAFCGFRVRDKISGAESEYKMPLEQNREYSGDELALKQLTECIVTGVWAILFRMDFLRSIAVRFTEGIISDEDCEFSSRVFSRCGRMAFSKKCPYVYVQHDGMITRTVVTYGSFLRYLHTSRTGLRVSRYILEHAKSPDVIRTVRNWALPDKLLKMLRVCAWNDDYEAYRAELASPGTRAALWGSWRSFIKDPGIFLKSLFVLAAPGLYFKIRRRSSPFRNKARRSA